MPYRTLHDEAPYSNPISLRYSHRACCDQLMEPCCQRYHPRRRHARKEGRRKGHPKRRIEHGQGSCKAAGKEWLRQAHHHDLNQNAFDDALGGQVREMRTWMDRPADGPSRNVQRQLRTARVGCPGDAPADTGFGPWQAQSEFSSARLCCSAGGYYLLDVSEVDAHVSTRRPDQREQATRAPAKQLNNLANRLEMFNVVSEFMRRSIHTRDQAQRWTGRARVLGCPWWTRRSKDGRA